MNEGMRQGENPVQERDLGWKGRTQKFKRRGERVCPGGTKRKIDEKVRMMLFLRPEKRKNKLGRKNRMRVCL